MAEPIILGKGESRIVTIQTMADIPETAPVITQAFCRHGLARYMKYDETAYLEWIKQLATAYIPDGYSACFRDTATNKVIAASIWRIGTNKTLSDEVIDKYSPIAHAHFQEPQYIKDADPSTVLYGEKVGALTIEEGGQQGIAEELSIIGYRYYKSRGIRYLVGSLTSPITIHVAVERHGYKVESEIVFDKSGIPEYKGIHGKGVLAVLDLDNWVDPGNSK